MSNTILIVDDEVSISRNLEKFFNTKGYKANSVRDGKSGIEFCRTSAVDIVLLDLRLPDMSGLDVLKRIKDYMPETCVIIITAHGDVETAVKAMQLKADNFVTKPIDLSGLETLVEKCLESKRTQTEVQYLKRKVSRLEGFGNLTNLRQPPEIYHAIKLLADNSSTNVLLLGETGTGKGMLANMIHVLSDRKDKPFVDINCAGLSSELLESELFGHEMGSFTDAKTSKRGLLEVANGGTVFLDEVADMSLSVQAKLLKAIEDKIFRRVGGTVNIEVDVRVMAATNTDLEKAVKDKKFREDLFFRLNVMPIKLPPLRERQDDIMPLAHIFMDEYKRLFSRVTSGFSGEVEAMFINYSWPGNIRELKNIIERAVLLCEGVIIDTEHLPDNLKTTKAVNAPQLGGNLTLDEIEKKHIENVLAACNNNRSRAAELLGIHRTTLIKKIKKYNIAS